MTRSDASQAQGDATSSDAAQTGANAAPGSTSGQPVSSPTAAAALAQALGVNGQPAPGGQAAAASAGSPGSPSAATPPTSPGPQAVAAQAAASAAANADSTAAAAASAATTPQAAPSSPLPTTAGDAASTGPRQGDGTKTSADGIKVTTSDSSASSAGSSTSASGYAAQLASQQAGTGNSTPSSDQPPADGGFEGAATAPVESKVGPTDATKDAAATANGTSDPKALQATALPGVTTDNGQAANVQAAAATQATATSSAATAAAVIQQVTVHISKAAVDGVDHINVQLNPPELGHVEVRMEVGPSGHFSAVFSADRPQTADMLQRNAHELTRSLQDAGVRTDAGSLSFNLRGQNQQGTPGWAGGFNGNGARNATPSWSNVPDEAPAPAAIYANSGVGTNRVDIRV